MPMRNKCSIHCGCSEIVRPQINTDRWCGPVCCGAGHGGYGQSGCAGGEQPAGILLHWNSTCLIIDIRGLPDCRQPGTALAPQTGNSAPCFRPRLESNRKKQYVTCAKATAKQDSPSSKS